MGAVKPVQVAILGAGGFVRDAYLSPLKANTDKLLPTAVWSRTSDSAAKLVPDIQAFSPSCKAYHGEDGLAELLSASDVQAVLVALPPQAQSAVIQASLRAGKHVLSEKPAAPSLVEAEQLLAFHQSLPLPAPLWCVAENYRSMPAFLRLRDVLASNSLGTVARLDMTVDLAMAPGNRYYESQWRRDSAGMPGAYLTEGGVHFVAALRMAARAAGFGEAVAAVAASRGVSPDLPHPDTLTGTLWFESGAAAGFSMSMAVGTMQVALSAAGTRGSAAVSRGGFAAAPGQGRTWRLVQQVVGDSQPVQEESSDPGVEAELLCFARLVAAATPAQGGVSLTLTAREAGAAAAADGSDPEADAASAAAGVSSRLAGEPSARLAGPSVVEEPGGHAALQQLPAAEDAYRISAVEAVWDLAVVAALLESAAAGGAKVQITWPGS